MKIPQARKILFSEIALKLAMICVEKKPSLYRKSDSKPIGRTGEAIKLLKKLVYFFFKFGKNKAIIPIKGK